MWSFWVIGDNCFIVLVGLVDGDVVGVCGGDGMMCGKAVPFCRVVKYSKQNPIPTPKPVPSAQRPNVLTITTHTRKD